MAKQWQLTFKDPRLKKPNIEFGGDLLKGNPKQKRPLDSKLPTLLTLRAEKSVLRLPKFYGQVNRLIEGTAKKYGFPIYSFENVGNHVHILLRVTKRSLWSKFIRELTGRIAQLYPHGSGKFWLKRPHTRIVQGWTRAFQIAKDYIYLNHLEAEGFIDRRETRTLADLRALLGGYIDYRYCTLQFS